MQRHRVSAAQRQSIPKSFLQGKRFIGENTLVLINVNVSPINLSPPDKV